MSLINLSASFFIGTGPEGGVATWLAVSGTTEIGPVEFEFNDGIRLSAVVALSVLAGAEAIPLNVVGHETPLGGVVVVRLEVIPGWFAGGKAVTSVPELGVAVIAVQVLNKAGSGSTLALPAAPATAHLA
jgi:hypothetical protein